MVLYKYQMSSWPVTLNTTPLIWTTTFLSKYIFSEITGLLDCLGYCTEMAATPIYGKTKYVSL